MPTEADIVGDGGGCGDPGRGLDDTSPSTTGDTGSSVGFEPPDLALDPDFVDALVSDLSKVPLGMSDCENEFLGLSDFCPGIFDLNPRKEREDSLVSDLLNEGYDCSPSTDLSSDVDDAFLGVLEPSPAFEGCWPIFHFDY